MIEYEYLHVYGLQNYRCMSICSSPAEYENKTELNAKNCVLIIDETDRCMMTYELINRASCSHLLTRKKSASIF